MELWCSSVVLFRKCFKEHPCSHKLGVPTRFVGTLRAQTKIPTRFVGTLPQQSTNIPRKPVGTVVPQGFLKQYYRTAPNVQEHLWEQVFPRDLWEHHHNTDQYSQKACGNTVFRWALWKHSVPQNFGGTLFPQILLEWYILPNPAYMEYILL